MNAEQFFASMKGKHVAFCGIGGSNLPLIDLFLSHGAIVSARDKRTKEALGDLYDELTGKGVTLVLGEDYLENLTEDVIFRTPGMKYYLPQLNAARARGAAVTSEMEVFFDLCPCKIYAVTGSDGKTTTTTILSEFLKAAGKTVHLGGNIGTPLLPQLKDIKPEDVAVAELSSFQLISMRRSPEVAIVTNLSPNHLDMHKDMQEYVDAKKNIFLHQNAFSRTVLNADNEITASFAEETRGETLCFSRKGKQNGAWVDENGRIFMGDTFVMNESDIKIPGKHNVENYLAAISAAWGDVPAEVMTKVAREFNGVEHRAELVRELNGVRWYNDSIATSPTRVMKGMLTLFPQKIILLAGGYDKKIPFDTLGPAICDRVKVAILMGHTAQKIDDSIRQSANFAEGNPVIIRVENMRQAVEAAHKLAKDGDIVALSPACAGFDLYKNFAERGRDFKAIVQSLKD